MEIGSAVSSISVEPRRNFFRISSHERGSDMAGNGGRGTKPLQSQWFVDAGQVFAGGNRVFFQH